MLWMALPRGNEEKKNRMKSSLEWSAIRNGKTFEAFQMAWMLALGQKLLSKDLVAYSFYFRVSTWIGKTLISMLLIPSYIWDRLWNLYSIHMITINP